MGVDATNRWLFAGDSEREQASAHRQLRGFLKNLFFHRGYERAPGDRAADRSFVLGPPARWIWLGDSFDTIDDEHRRESPAVLTQRLDLHGVMASLAGHGPRLSAADESRSPGELAPLLSQLGSVAKLDVSDSAILEVVLYERGHEIDRYANGKTPFFCFSNEQEAEPWRGHPEYWRHVLEPGRTVDELRAAWTQAIGGWPTDGSADYHAIHDACIELLGFSELLESGYTLNPEGIPYRYSRWMTRSQRAEFTELHFRWPGSPGRGHWEDP